MTNAPAEIEQRPATTADEPSELESHRAAMEAAPPSRRSPWTKRQNIGRILWASVGRLIWMLVPPARQTLLRAFGARVGTGCIIARSAEITIPWNLDMGNDVVVGERAIIYSLGRIWIGDGTVIDYRAHL